MSLRSTLHPLAVPALMVGVATFALPAHAQDRQPQYRVLELTDGRTITAEILGTEATGLALRTPQGDSLVSFELLVDMQPTDAAGYQAQGDWMAYVAVSDDLLAVSTELLEAIPGVTAAKVGTAVRTMTADDAAAAIACSGAIPCLVNATSDSEWMWLITSETNDDGQTVLKGAVSQGRTRASSEPFDGDSRDALWTALHQAMALAPPSREPPPVRGRGGPTETGPKSKEMTPGKVTALSFIPIPGATAAIQGDWGNAALGLGLGAGGIGASVAGSILSSEGSSGSTVATLVGGSLVSVVFANQVSGMRAYQRNKDRSVGLVPMTVEGKGAGAMVVVR